MTGKRYAALACATLVLALQSSTAYADWPPGGQNPYPTGPSGNSHGTTISASAGGVTFATEHNGTGPSAGPITPAGNWTPPPCWYAPTYTPAQFKQEATASWDAESVGNDWRVAQENHYANGHPYKDYNMAKTGKGYWWTGVANMADIADPAATSCTKPTFWVDNGQPPPPDPRNVSPQILAELAYGRIRVPSTRVTLNPTGLQTVNLNTWAWLDKARFKPVSVTASVAALNISATTTATPIALHLDPGTTDATVYPASGDCPINPDGSIGTPYAASDSDNTPPCGLTYLRSTTGHAPYSLRATLTWRIAWTGTGDTGGALPNGTFGTARTVTVQEIQNVVR